MSTIFNFYGTGAGPGAKPYDTKLLFACHNGCHLSGWVDQWTRRKAATFPADWQWYLFVIRVKNGVIDPLLEYRALLGLNPVARGDVSSTK